MNLLVASVRMFDYQYDSFISSEIRAFSCVLIVESAGRLSCSCRPSKYTS